MKITAIHARNFLGIRAADIIPATPVTLICGPNGAGKSSIQEAVRMALTEETVRVGLKKEYGKLLRDGTESGSIVVSVGAQANSVVLPSGKATKGIPTDARTPFVLDAQRFARMDVKERRAFLFDLMGLKIGTDQVRERLVARGCVAKKIEAVLPLVRAGFDAAAKEAGGKATAAKGAWRELTGETYGSVKAASWVAPVPAGAEDPAELASLIAESEETIKVLSTEAGELQRQLGEIDAAARQRAQRASQIADLRAKAELLPKAQDTAARALAERDAFLPKVAALRDAAGGKVAGMPCTCPDCGAMLLFLAGQLAKYEPEKVDPEAAGRLPEYERSLTVLENALKSRTAERDAADTAAKQLRLLLDQAAGEATESADDVERQAIASRLEAIQGSIAQFGKDLDAARASQRAAAQAGELTKRAGQHHADVAAWDALAEALGPSGIPADLLSEALDPINERLAAAANESEWMRIGIESDMTITAAGGRPYALLSESERWRADAMIAEAISRLTGLRLLVLDRADVLIGPERDRLLYWLADLADADAIDTALIFMSLKSPPGALPESITSFWIADHEVGTVREAA
ncbi:AAA family ATPase [Cupriavidus basilensis]|uniref:AAA family ATPase n=1 Tax=Cupriavidus basilensis TaxID=68895 RepID=UPI0020A6274F|nr:ATP-binding protein [Cupriavidus basilensis]MCP3017497.1 ATP-binding protein [Cupriavidus basilensis]